MVRGLAGDDAAHVCSIVSRSGASQGPGQLHDAGIGAGALRRLAQADAFRSIGLDRQAALWEIRLLEQGTMPLFPAGWHGEGVPSASHRLPAMPAVEEVCRDYAATGLSLKAHPMSFLRTHLETRGVVTAASVGEVEEAPPMVRRAAVAGLVLVRQRPHSAKGMVFMTIEDETGAANIVMTPQVESKCRVAVRTSPAVVVHGVVERRGEVVHLKADHVEGIAVEAIRPATARRQTRTQPVRQWR